MLFIIINLFFWGTRINGSFYKYTPKESPQTINITEGQALVLAEMHQRPTLVITIPEIFSSPRYVTPGHKFFSFVNNATVTIHFLSNISFYVANNWKSYNNIENGCDFLFNHFNFECGDDTYIENEYFTTHYITKKDKNIARYSDRYYGHEIEIKDFSSQPPYTLKIKASPSLISNATVEIDFGFGKQPISIYNETFKLLPFNAKFYITYNTCDSFLFRSVSLNSPKNETVSLKMNNIPEKCFSFSASILVSLDFPNAKLFYKLGDENISPFDFIKGTYLHLSRNFPFTLTFYVKYLHCIDFYLIKIVSVNEHSKPRIIHIFASDIPDICE